MSAIAKRVTAFIQSRPALDNMMKPIANKYMDLAGYRKLGLLYGSLHPLHQFLSFASLRLQTCRHIATPTVPHRVIPGVC